MKTKEIKTEEYLKLNEKDIVRIFSQIDQKFPNLFKGYTLTLLEKEKVINDYWNMFEPYFNKNANCLSFIFTPFWSLYNKRSVRLPWVIDQHTPHKNRWNKNATTKKIL